MTDITMIALSKLIESEDNVRRSNRKDGIGELAASIRSHGILSSLCVLDTGKGKYAVIAGGRRLRALRLLAKAGDIEKHTLIPCRVVSPGEATELSLAENVVRVNLDAHDEILAVAKLADDGLGVESIAARFGISPQHVARRLNTTLARQSTFDRSAQTRRSDASAEMRSFIVLPSAGKAAMPLEQWVVNS